jgi:hypothetical protein
MWVKWLENWAKLSIIDQKWVGSGQNLLKLAKIVTSVFKQYLLIVLQAYIQKLLSFKFDKDISLWLENKCFLLSRC